MGRDSFLFLVVAILSGISNSRAQDSKFDWSKTLSIMKNYMEKIDELPAIFLGIGTEEAREWRPQDTKNITQVLMANIMDMVKRKKAENEALGTIFMFIYTIYYVLFSIYSYRHNVT